MICKWRQKGAPKEIRLLKYGGIVIKLSLLKKLLNNLKLLKHWSGSGSARISGMKKSIVDNAGQSVIAVW